MAGSSRTAIAAAVLALAAAVATPAPAYAVAPSGTYSNWYWPGPSTGYYNVDERVTIIGHSPGTHYFWAHQVGFVGGDGGYLGLQVGSYPSISQVPGADVHEMGRASA